MTLTVTQMGSVHLGRLGQSPQGERALLAVMAFHGEDLTVEMQLTFPLHLSCGLQSRQPELGTSSASCMALLGHCASTASLVGKQ